MESNIENLRSLLERLKNITIWQRIFGWRTIRMQLMEAYAELQRLLTAQENIKDKLQHEQTESKVLQSANNNLSARNIELQTELATLKQRAVNLEDQLRTAINRNTELLKDDAFRKDEHSKALATLQQIQTRVTEEREQEKAQRNEAELQQLLKQKETWSNHQQQVQQAVKSICNSHTIEYIDKVPFRGEPDNSIRICDEYVIFDAKSPAGNDLSNFATYLKDQAEKAKKYAKQNEVKTDIFFVVPSNTLDTLSQFVYRIGDYNVYIISTASLEPVILSLQKIEAYEFAEQLSPEERENICRILGKFAHLSKRRIQVDSFFAKQFIELAYKSENDLPKEMHDKMLAFEKAEKLNPPIEKRAKEINLKELEQEADKIAGDAVAKGIYLGDLSAELNKAPLYNKEL